MTAAGANDAAPVLRVEASHGAYVEGGNGYRILVGRTGGSESRSFLGLEDRRLPALAFAVEADDEGWTVEVPTRVRYGVFVAGVEPETTSVPVVRRARHTATRADISVWTPGNDEEHRVRLEWAPAAAPPPGDFLDRMAEKLASKTVYADGLLDPESTNDRALILSCSYRVERAGKRPATDAQILELIGQENNGKNRERVRARLKRVLPDVCVQRFQMESTEFEELQGRPFTRQDAVEYLVRTGQVTKPMVARALAIERAATEEHGPW